MKPQRKIAIVTPDFVGPVRNGGVGTAMYWLAKAFAKSGYTVDVLFTGVIEAGRGEGWARTFREEHGFDFIDLLGWCAEHAPRDAARRFFPDSENRRISHLALQFLKRQDYAAIYFQDYLGHGLRTLQYKRAGLGFADTRCIVTLHSCQRWIREGMEQMPAGVPDLELDFQERESALLADALIAPSRHMARWVARHWGIHASRIDVVPYCFEEPVAPPPRRRVTHTGFSHLVFFGRLETRKGLHFVLHALATSGILRERIKRVTFLGKRATVHGRSSGEAISEALRGLPYACEIIDSKNAVEAWDWLRAQRDVLVVAPSTLDNLPFSIIELFCRRMPFITTDIGGIPEIVGAANGAMMAPASSAGLTVCLERFVSAGELATDYRSGYEASRANRANVAHLRAQLTSPPTRPAKSRQARGAVRSPLVSVIVTHFNCSGYLALSLETLRRQDVTWPYEVIVIDDCSDRPEERARFRALAERYDRKVFRFVESRRNRGPGAARNLGAAHARARFLAFFDADNEAEPFMLRTMVRAIEQSGCDCLSCFSSVVPQADRAAPRPLDVANESLVYAPLGACLDAGFRYNLYGDTCAIWKKRVFDAVGGFSEKRVKFEDWELFTRMAVRGYRLGVIPELLYRYRSQDGSYNTQALDFASRALILENYNRPEAVGRVDVAALCAVLAEETGAKTRSNDASAYDFFTGIRDEHLESILDLERVTGSSERGLQDIQAMRRCVESRMAKWLVHPPRIMIYGAGLHTKVLLATNPALARWVVGFIDQKRRDTFLGRPCIGPDAFSSTMAETVVYSSRPNERQMYANLAHHAVEHVLIYTELPPPPVAR